MTLQELAKRENDLYSKVIELYNQVQTSDTDKQLKDIFSDYKKVHQQYADLASSDIEALKRALFIQWYALSEPSYLTGISELDEEIENKVLDNLNAFIEHNKIDHELTWMLNYYARWDWIFDRLIAFKGFDKRIVNEQNNELPDTIDREAMQSRGQMGQYWNSLTRYRAK